MEQFSIKDILQWLSVLAFLWAIWQFVLRRKWKRQEIKYITYNKTSEVVNRLNKNYETLLLAFFKSNPEQLSNKLNLVNSYINQFNMAIDRIKEQMSEIKEQRQKSSLQLDSIADKIKIAQENPDIMEDNVAILNEQKEKINSASDTLDELQDHLNNLRTNQLERAANTFNDVIDRINQITEERRRALYAFSIELEGFLLDFNEISDLKIISSIKVLKLVEAVKLRILALKRYLSKSLNPEITMEEMFDIIESTELTNLISSKEQLLSRMREELN